MIFYPLIGLPIGEAEIERVVACLKSGWITTGPVCKEFEEKFSLLTGAPCAISLTSGTAGMHLTLSALDLQKGMKLSHLP